MADFPGRDLVAVLGYGDVGGPTAACLAGLGVPVRVGGRDPARADVVTDYRSPESLRRFASGCRVVVNCAGPSREVGDRVACAALDAGAAYVDAAGDDPLHDALTAFPGTAVLSAGLSPGLTGLLPRWAGGGQAKTLVSHLAVLDRFTPTAAADYLDGVTEPLAAWRDGRPAPGALTRRTADLPFLPGRATLLPHLSPEARRTAVALGLDTGEWWSVLTGSHVLAAFDSAHGRSDAVAALCRASDLDLAGRSPHVVLSVETDPGRSVVLRGTGNGPLSGAVCALTAYAVLLGEVPPGRHFAADVLDPDTTITRLRAQPAVLALHDAELEDGTL